MNFFRHGARASVLGLAALSLVSSSACVPVRTAPVTVARVPSRDGVALSVVRVACNENVDPDWPDADLVDTTVEARVENRSAAPVVIHRDRFRLVVPDGGAVPSSTLHAAAPLAVDAGGVRVFQLRFAARGGLACSAPIRLDAGNVY